MGYTHYWYVNRSVESNKLAAAQFDMHKIIEAAKVPLGDALGSPGSKPIQEEGRLWFNGVAPDKHETFVWPPDLRDSQDYLSAEDKSQHFTFCKTQRALYDHVVAACLIAAKDHLGDDIEVLSDGSPEEFLHQKPAAWFDNAPEDAVSLYERAIGKPAVSPLNGSEA